jgi:hypothetical protein
VSPPRLFIAVRADLPPAIAGVQACHAVARAVAGKALAEDTHFVLVEVPRQDDLLRLADQLEADGQTFELFDEPDDQLGPTALATPPGDKRTGRRFARWPLWRGGLA